MGHDIHKLFQQGRLSKPCQWNYAGIDQAGGSHFWTQSRTIPWQTCILMTCGHALKRWKMHEGPANCSIVSALTTSFTSSTVESMYFDAQQCAYQYLPTCKLIPVQLIHYHETTMSNLHDSQFIFPPSALH